MKKTVVFSLPVFGLTGCGNGRERKNKVLNLIRIMFFSLFFILGISCVSKPVKTIARSLPSIDTEINITLPLLGSARNVNITTDFVPIGIVFVNSTEVIDGLGNNTGSKITYEMFMREASRLQAHDVINISIDVNIKKERKIVLDRSVIVTTYSYTGSGLAIRYANAKLENKTNSIYDLPDNMIIQNNNNIVNYEQIISEVPVSQSVIAIDDNLTVLSVNGSVWQRSERSRFTRVNVNDIIIANTIININRNSSIILNDGITSYTLIGPQNGRIVDLIK